jgi:hypothetical protein
MMGSKGKENWNQPRPATIPRPTAAPAAMAFGLTFFFWGLISSPVVLAAGIALVIFALAAWIREMRHE